MDQPIDAQVRPISRKEYDQMVALGILDEDEHIELLRGAIVKMSPQGWHHMTVVCWLNEELIRRLDPGYQVRPQGPFAASEWSEPEPDIGVAVKDYTLRDHPSSLLLVIEVADSSLRKDRKVKTTIYAEAGVPEYWIVDLETMTIEVYTKPVDGRYEHMVVLRDGDTLRPVALPTVELAISDIPR